MPRREISRSIPVKSVLVICPSRVLQGELSPLLAEKLPMCEQVDLAYYPNGRALDETLRAKPPSICFLDAGSNGEMAFGVLEELLRNAPKLPVIAVLAANDAELILQCVRRGAADFLVAPLTAEQLDSVLSRLQNRYPALRAMEEGGRVICVQPVKGSCGASTLASNLVFQFKRLGKSRILLADMDPSTGTISFLLKLKSNYSFLDALSRIGTLDADLWRGLVTPVNGVDVLLPPENPVDCTPDLPDPEPVFQFCRQIYELIVIDSARPAGPWPLSLAQTCDDLLLVTTNELPALRATQRILQHLDANMVDRAKIKVVVNRYNPKTGLHQDAIETALQSEVYKVLPTDQDAIKNSLVGGKPAAANSSFGKSVAELADTMEGFKAVAARRKSGSLGAILSALVSRVG